ncbi:MAG: type II toxin-antitoxin system HicA family toxin [Bdellovibrionales bacterium]|nr:type II toxin-antitoxin system HicA family toxin [Bdellovibrionales bacterium]
MNSKHQKTLEKVFKDPVSPSIPWRDIEKLFLALGGEVKEGAGSRVRVKLGDVFAVFHRPHPERVTDKGAVKSVRKFLTNSGVLENLEDNDA